MWERLKSLFNASGDGSAPGDPALDAGTPALGAAGADGDPALDAGVPASGAAGADGDAVRVTGVRYLFTTKEEPNAGRPFAHGFVDGMEGVERAPFERFLVQASEHDRLGEEMQRLAERERELQAAERERTDVKAHIEHDTHLLAALDDEVAAAEADLDAARADLDAERRQEQAARDRLTDTSTREQAPPRGSFVYAALYVTAGLIFIAGDIVMAREVVAKALKLSGNVEPWIFAVGLAMLAVLMKPAYDRLVEKPYWEGRQWAFRWTIAIGVVVAALVLGVLGAFRSEAFAAQQEIRRLDDDLLQGLRSGQIEAGSEAETQRRTEIAQRERSLTESSTGWLSFLLSGVLFAAAGAVCLGIGLHHGRDWYHGPARRWRLRRLVRWRSPVARLEGAVEEAKARCADVRRTRADRQGRLASRRARLAHMPTVDEVRAERAEVRETWAALRAARSIGIANQRIDAYHNGYDLADARRTPTPPRGDGMVEPEQITMEATPPQGDGSAGGGNGSGNGSGNGADDGSSRRPFLALRDAIARNALDR